MTEEPLPRSEAESEALAVHAARRILAMRRLRDRMLGAEHFADPAWDILLDLYAQSRDGRQVSVSHLCMASASPTTTALRWINKLVRAGVLARSADPDDARRVFVSFTRRGGETMRLFLATAIAEMTAPMSQHEPPAERPAAQPQGKRARRESLRSRCATSPSSSTPSSTRDRATASSS